MKNKWRSVITSRTQFQQKLSAVTPRKEHGLTGCLEPGPQREAYIHLSMRPEDLHNLNSWHSAFLRPHLLPAVNQVNIHTSLGLYYTRVHVCEFALLWWNYKALTFSVYLKNCGKWKCRLGTEPGNEQRTLSSWTRKPWNYPKAHLQKTFTWEMNSGLTF